MLIQKSYFILKSFQPIVMLRRLSFHPRASMPWFRFFFKKQSVDYSWLQVFFFFRLFFSYCSSTISVHCLVVTMLYAFLRGMLLGVDAKVAGLKTKRLENVSVNVMAWFVETMLNVLSAQKDPFVSVWKAWWVTPSLGVPVPLPYARLVPHAHPSLKLVKTAGVWIHAVARIVV